MNVLFHSPHSFSRSLLFTLSVLVGLCLYFLQQVWVFSYSVFTVCVFVCVCVCLSCIFQVYGANLEFLNSYLIEFMVLILSVCVCVCVRVFCVFFCVCVMYGIEILCYDAGLVRYLLGEEFCFSIWNRCQYSEFVWLLVCSGISI